MSLPITPRLMPKPPQLTFEEAAVYPLGGSHDLAQFPSIRLGNGKRFYWSVPRVHGHRALEIAMRAIGLRRTARDWSGLYQEKKDTIEALSDPNRNFEVVGHIANRL